MGEVEREICFSTTTRKSGCHGTACKQNHIIKSRRFRVTFMALVLTRGGALMSPSACAYQSLCSLVLLYTGTGK